METGSPSSGTDSEGSGRSREWKKEKMSTGKAWASVSRGFPKVVLKESPFRGPEAGSPPLTSAAQASPPLTAEYAPDVSRGMGTFGTEPEHYKGKTSQRIGSARGTPIKGEGTPQKESPAQRLHVTTEWSEDRSSSEPEGEFKFWRRPAEGPRAYEEYEISRCPREGVRGHS